MKTTTNLCAIESPLPLADLDVNGRGLAERYRIAAGRREDVLCREGDGLKLPGRCIPIPNAPRPARISMHYCML
ncbi:hypothetical protein [Azotobacter vinelandii]|nr:hypothetical protein [Azotobacter vinelandii]WKN21136.1 hypothetical protein AVAEIV_004200 [Azotobacter vinelandii]